MDRNQDAPLDESGMVLGEQRSIRVTDGGLYDNTKVERVMRADVGLERTRRVNCLADRTVSSEYLATDSTIDESVSTVDCNVERTVTRRRLDEGGVERMDELVVHKVKSAVSHARYATESSRTVVTVNAEEDDPSIGSSANGEASARVNEHGTFTTTLVTIQPKKVESEWVTWESTDVTPGRFRYKYAHGIKIFRNCTREEIPKPLVNGNGCRGNIQATVNRYGLFDGQVSYSYIKSYTENADYVASLRGGSKTGTLTVPYAVLAYTRYSVAPARPTVTVSTLSIPVISFWGTKDDDDEAEARAADVLIPGVKLPPRTYVHAPRDGGQSQVQANQAWAQGDEVGNFLEAREDNKSIRTEYAADVKVGWL